MKRLVGGDYLLDLSSIEIEESVDGTTKTNITDSDVLEQLTNLKKYIKNPEMAKPVWVKLVNGENDELVVARGTFSVVDTGEFEICVQLDGYKLVIFIEFTQATLSDNTPIDDWYIDTNDAKYLFTSDAQNIGAISELPVFENIVDAQGHKRFIEGDINLMEDVPATITKVYGKWSLSGSHLMLVLALDIGIAEYEWIGGFADIVNLPQWILDKIYPSSALSNSYVDFKGFYAFSEDSSNQQISAYLRKEATAMYISLNGVSVPKQRYTRITFDLLIDNETPESQGE